MEVAKADFLELCSLIGEPISHDANNSIIWDIKRNESSASSIKTYSEHSHEAMLHTDSQYSFYPEDYFSLLCLKQSDCGGGISYLLSLDDILSELRAKENGAEIEEILRTVDFPFLTPSVFKKTGTNGNEYNFGPILLDDEIRFRIDTFEKTMEENPELCTRESVYAYSELKDIVINSEKIKAFYLEPQDIIFINNKTMLHGRSSFEDAKRHLLRIRMNKQ